MSLLDLNKEQQRAFNRLKKAHKDCEKLGVLLVNEYGTMTAYDSNLIESHSDRSLTLTHRNPVKYIDVQAKFFNENTFKTCSGMADDDILWVLGLTDKGLEIYESE